ncbi:MAG: group II truncated hemoglobin [Gemmatimonadetes bacterium]|nr:group II truncated hemoglobin [Gemmatimonadota bacterium]
MTQLEIPYELVGGDVGVRALVDRFYDLMDNAPEAGEIRSMHAPSLKASREKLYLFLCGWLGGPQLYVEQYGHPRLRARHLPFPIGSQARDQWLWCMDRALATHEMPAPLRASLRQKLHDLADHMRNHADPLDPPAGLSIV